MKRAISAALVAALMAALLYTVIRNGMYFPHDPDLYWHARTGKDMIVHGWSPFHDHYSFTYPGAPIALPATLFDLALGGMDLMLGLTRAVSVIRCLLLLSALALFSGWLLKRRIPALIAGPALVYFGTAILWFPMFRPELTAYPLALIFVGLYLRSRSEFTPRWLGAQVALLVLWVNIHVTAAIGFVLVAALCLEKLIGGEPRERKRAVLFGLASFAAGFANPSFTHPLLFLAGTSGKWSQYILEHTKHTIWSRAPFELIYWVLVLAVAAIDVRRRLWGNLLIYAFLLYVSFDLEKFYRLLVVVSLPLVVDALDASMPALRALATPVRAVLVTVTLIFSVQSLYELVAVGASLDAGTAEASYPYPGRILDYLQATAYRGNVLADHGLASTLLYARGGDALVYIDGRTNILYPLSLMKRYTQITARFEDLREETAARKIDGLFLNSNTWPILENSVLTGLYSVDFVSEPFAFLTHRRNPLPRSAALLFVPECWSAAWVPELKKEALAADRVPSGSDQRAMLEFVSDLTAPPALPERMARLRALASTSEKPALQLDSVLRLAEYLALGQGDFALAKTLALKIHIPLRRDVFALSREMLHDGDAVPGERLIHSLMTAAPPTPREFHWIAGFLDDATRLNQPLTTFTPRDFQAVRAGMAAYDPGAERQACDRLAAGEAL